MHLDRKRTHLPREDTLFQYFMQKAHPVLGKEKAARWESLFSFHYALCCEVFMLGWNCPLINCSKWAHFTKHTIPYPIFFLFFWYSIQLEWNVLNWRVKIAVLRFTSIWILLLLLLSTTKWHDTCWILYNSWNKTRSSGLHCCWLLTAFWACHQIQSKELQK